LYVLVELPQLLFEPVSALLFPVMSFSLLSEQDPDS
jgi:hypothetical protein